MSESDYKPKPEEKFQVMRRWDELDLVEKMKLERERGKFAGMTSSEQAYIEKLSKNARKHYLGEE